MKHEDVDRSFAGSIPQLYEKLLVPLIFKPYAPDLAARAQTNKPSALLEIAAGTGVVTRELAQVLPHETSIVATDLNQPMIDHAASIGTARPVQWRHADAMQLPFPDGSFDMVVCQFGVMFFPDKAAGFAEARRVLRPGGVFLFNAWDKIETNEFADLVTSALAALFPSDPPRFLARTPHGYHDRNQIARDLERGGFANAARIDTIPARSRADSPLVPAIAYCQGTPLRNEIEARDSSRLELATERAAQAIAQQFGPGPVDGAIQAHIVSATK
jgi:SAM-dependent methyltransferase